MDAIYTRYYNHQSGDNVHNIGEIYHTPRIIQNGRGIGSLFSSLLSHLKPLLKTGLNVLKNKSIDIGKDILEEIGSKPLKNILINQGRKAVNHIKEVTLERLDKLQKGEGRRIKLKRLKHKPQNRSKRCRGKNIRDIFDN